MIRGYFEAAVCGKLASILYRARSVKSVKRVILSVVEICITHITDELVLHEKRSIPRAIPASFGRAIPIAALNDATSDCPIGDAQSRSLSGDDGSICLYSSYTFDENHLCSGHEEIECSCDPPIPLVLESLDPDKLTRLGHKLGLGMLNLSRNRDSPPQDRVKLHPVMAAAVRELAIDQCELDGFLTQRESQDVRTQLYEPAF